MGLEVVIDNMLAVFCAVNGIKHMNNSVRELLLEYLRQYENRLDSIDMYAVGMSCMYFIQEMVESLDEVGILDCMNKFFSLDLTDILKQAELYCKES